MGAMHPEGGSQPPGWLDYIGDEILPSYMRGIFFINFRVYRGIKNYPIGIIIIINHEIRIPFLNNQDSSRNVGQGFGSRCSIGRRKIFHQKNGVKKHGVKFGTSTVE